MNKSRAIHKILTYLIATIWVANGLFCKLLDLVPRHQLIVERILGKEYAGVLTTAIGIAELLMAIWILSGIQSRLNAIVQIILIATMNITEFFLAPDLLLFGKNNLLLALFLIAIIYYNEFVLHKKLTGQA